MLGKGLESLIPHKGNGNGGSGNGNNSNPNIGAGSDSVSNAGGTGGVNAGGNDTGKDRDEKMLEPAHSDQAEILGREPEELLEPGEPPELLEAVEQRAREAAGGEAERQPEERAREPLEQEQHANTYRTGHDDEPREPQREARSEPPRDEFVFQIEVEKIKPNPGQPRRIFDESALRDLANSIREFGFLQPLVVSKIEKESPTGIEVGYELIAGERRLMAAKLLGLPVVPAIVRNVNLEREKLELAVIENIQRENLNPIETARAFQRLQEEFRMTQREIAAKLGKSRESVANTVRLLDLPEDISAAVERHQLSESHARLLLAIQDPAAQKHLFDDIVRNQLTTREVKERVDREIAMTRAAHGGADRGEYGAGGHRRGRPPKSEEHLPPELRALQDSLSNDLGAPVEIYKGQAKGSITITFYSEEELRAIMQRLGKEES